jgi:hypothetical protein
MVQQLLETSSLYYKSPHIFAFLEIWPLTVPSLEAELRHI